MNFHRHTCKYRKHRTKHNLYDNKLVNVMANLFYYITRTNNWDSIHFLRYIKIKRIVPVMWSRLKI